VTHGAQWVGAGAVFPLPANQSGPTPSAFGIDPSAKPLQASPVPAAQSLPQPNNPPASPLVPAVPQNGAPTMALPPAPLPTPPASQNQNANQPGSYEPLPTFPPATPTKPTPNGACGDIDSLLNATQSGHGCTQP